LYDRLPISAKGEPEPVKESRLKKEKAGENPEREAKKRGRRRGVRE